MKLMNRQPQKKIMTMLAVLAVAVMAGGMVTPIWAAGTKEYKVSFKPGDKGTFASIDVKVPYQENINVDLYEPDGQDIKSGYYFTGWSPEAEGNVEITKQTTFVAQYARIIDEAVYRVNYVDTFGNAVFTQKVVTTNTGARVTETAEPIENYAVDAAVKSVTAEKEGKTEITFIYTSTLDPNIVTETETVILPGGTPITVIGNGTGTSAPAGDAGTATGTTASPAPADETAPEAEDEETEGGETVQSPDEDVPLGDMDESNKGGVKESKDEEVPLANEKASSNVWKYVVAGGAILALLAATYVIVKRKNMNRGRD